MIRIVSGNKTEGKEMEEFYKQRYGKPLSVMHDPRLKKVINVFKNYNLEVILDVGCGDGSFSIPLKEAGHASEVYGVELSDEGIAKAASRGVKVSKVNLNNNVFPFSNNYFNGIFCGGLSSTYLILMVYWMKCTEF